MNDWLLRVRSVDGEFKWALFNRDGDLVMLSRDSFSTHDQAEAAASYEARLLKEVVVV